jgi:hypothetical protein
MRFAGIWLAENYLRAAGVAAVWIGATGHVGSQDVASIAVERALESVSSVNQRQSLDGQHGELVGFNRVFTAARKADPGIMYSDYLQGLQFFRLAG